MAPNNVVNVQLNANTATFVTGMSKAASAAKSAGSEIRGAFDKLGDVASVALAPFGELGVILGSAFRGIGDLAPAAIKSLGGVSEGALAFAGAAAGVAAAGAAIGGALAGLAISGSEAIERLVIISQKTGIAIGDLQSFEAVGLTVDVSLEDMVTAMRKFDQALTGSSKNAGLARTILHDLGVTTRDPKEAILEVADAFKKMDDGAVKGAIAVALFGKSGLTMVPELNKGRDGFKEATEAVEKYGQSVSGQAIAANEKWQSATRDLSLAWEGFRIKLAENVLPTISDLIDKIAISVKWIADLIDKIKSMPGISLSKPNNADEWNQMMGLKPRPPANGGKMGGAGGSWGESIAAENAFDVLEAGGPAQAALAKLKEEIQAKKLEGMFQEASALEKQLPMAQARAKVEKEITDQVEKRLVAQLHELAAMKEQSAGKELGPQFKAGFFEGRTTAAFGPTPIGAAGPVPGPDTIPDVTQSQEQLDAISQSIHNVLTGKIQEGTQSGADALGAFYLHWSQENKKATEQITEDYQTQLVRFQGLLALGEIDETQFQAVRVALQQEASRKIIKARDEEIKTWDEEALKWGTVKDKFQALTNELALDGQNLGGKVFESLHKAIDDLSTQLAQFVVTGKANFKQLFQSLEASIAKAGFQKIFSSVANTIGSKFGLSIPGAGGSKGPSGTALDPIFVSMADTGALGGLGGLVPSGGSSDGGGLAGSLGLLKGLIPFLASGGDVTPGRAYIVGEKHPEFFIPNAPGQVSPSISMGGKQTVVNFHVHGVSDFDSFRKSQGQIMGDLHRSLSMAHGRNY